MKKEIPSNKDENGSTVQQNAYDGLSRRITRETGSVVTHTYWSDRWKPLEERTGSSASASRSYLWGERPGHRDELVLRDRDTNGDGTLDERLYATMDYFNGTAVLDTSGAVLERYAYSAFGVRRIMAADFSPRSTSSYAWDFGFQGQFRDAETGWYNYGYRFYVPELGSWVNRDPLSEKFFFDTYSSKQSRDSQLDLFESTFLLYQFTDNNPTNILDKLGLNRWRFPIPVITDPYQCLTPFGNLYICGPGLYRAWGPPVNFGELLRCIFTFKTGMAKACLCSNSEGFATLCQGLYECYLEYWNMHY
jgi:RHS repeat-associated protein